MNSLGAEDFDQAKNKYQDFVFSKEMAESKQAQEHRVEALKNNYISKKVDLSLTLGMKIFLVAQVLIILYFVFLYVLSFIDVTKPFVQMNIELLSYF